jgi:hypothetical protein
MKLVQNIDNLSLPGTVKVIKAGLWSGSYLKQLAIVGVGQTII